MFPWYHKKTVVKEILFINIVTMKVFRQIHMLIDENKTSLLPSKNICQRCWFSAWNKLMANWITLSAHMSVTSKSFLSWIWLCLTLQTYLQCMQSSFNTQSDTISDTAHWKLFIHLKITKTISWALRVVRQNEIGLYSSGNNSLLLFPRFK